jgi:TPR repeat protein
MEMREGIRFEFGIGRKRNYRKAFERYQIGSEHGIPSAMVRVGLMHKIGQGCTSNISECLKWLRRAADMGDRYGIREIGVCYEFGEGFARSKRKAHEWYWLGKESGDFESYRLWLRLWLHSKAHWFYRKGTLSIRQNTEFYVPKLLFKYKELQIRHYSDDLDVFHDYLYFIDYLFEEFDSVIDEFLYD